jgi:hypothetical protein
MITMDTPSGDRKRSDKDKSKKGDASLTRHEKDTKKSKSDKRERESKVKPNVQQT